MIWKTEALNNLLKKLHLEATNGELPAAVDAWNELGAAELGEAKAAIHGGGGAG